MALGLSFPKPERTLLWVPERPKSNASFSFAGMYRCPNLRISDTDIQYLKNDIKIIFKRKQCL